jgi:hypothetical protein
MRYCPAALGAAILLGGLLLLAACARTPATAAEGPTAPPPTTIGSPTAGATPSVAPPSPTPSPAPPESSAASSGVVVVGTAAVSAPASGVTIEIVGPSADHLVIEPGQRATVAIGHGEIDVLVHSPTSFWVNDSAGSHPYPISITVEPADWTAILGNWANPQTLTLHLYGQAPGPHTVTISVKGSPVGTIRFTLDIQPTTTEAATPAASPSGMRTVTLADAGQTIELAVGETFLLALGSEYDWTVTVADPSIVSREVNVATIRGSQGLYRANRPGRTTLTAIGDPPCRRARPACALPSRIVRIDLVVR